VLLDRSAAENALEIVVAFSTAEDEIAAVKSDLIKAVRAAVDTQFGKPIAGDVGPSITERTDVRT
jgi:hypothetical protein